MQRLLFLLFILFCQLAFCVVATAQTNVTYTVSSSSDDAYQGTTGFMSTNTTIIPFNSYQGYRFQNVDIPPGATITSATLEFSSAASATSDIASSIACEDADSGAAFSSSSNNISNRTLTSAQTNWSVGSTSYSNGQRMTTPDFAASVQEVIDRGGWSSGNSIVVIAQPDSGSPLYARQIDFSGTPAELHVTYTTTPDPAGTLLLVTAGSSLTSEESARQAQFESWGYTVNTIEDGETQTNFDTATAAADVVYVPQSADDAELAYKLRTASIGVVQEGVNGWDDNMGWSTSTGQNTNVCANMTVTDNTHPVSRHFSTGSRTIFNSSTASYGSQVIATVASGARVLATNNCVNSGNACLLTFEIGATLANTYDGNDTATSRRVRLPYGGGYTFAWSNVSADGLTMVQEALEWASTDGLVAHWKLDETSGTTTADATGNGHDGTLVNSPTWSTSAMRGGSLRFNNSGSTDRVDAGTIAITREITMAAWVYPESFSYDSRIIVKSSNNGGSGQEWRISINSSGAGQILIRTTGGYSVLDAPSGSFVTGKWQHLAGTYDGTTMRVYVNGVLAASSNHSSGGDLDVQSSRTVTLGDSVIGDREFYGYIDDARVYDRALNDAQVLELYGLIGHWKLDENSGTTAADSSGLGHHGTLVGSPAWESEGVRSGGLRYDYTDGNDYVELPNSETLDNLQEGSYSIATWFKPSSVPPETGSGNLSGYGLVKKPSNSLGLHYSHITGFQFNHYADEGSGPVQQPITASVYEPDAWHHVVATVDKEAGLVSLYVNGSLVGTNSFSPGGETLDWGSEKWRLGISNPSGSSSERPAHGVQDDVVLYNRVMTPEEIAEHYGLIAHWKLDEASGTTAVDSSLAGNDATLTGTQGWATGFDGGAHAFDYTDGEDYFQAPNNTMLDEVNHGDFTVMAYVRPNSVPPGSGSDNDAVYAILIKEGNHAGILYDANQQFHFAQRLSDGSQCGTGTSSNAYAPGSWYHVAGVFDSTSGESRIYINGQLVNTESFTAGTAGYALGTAPWRVGIAGPGWSTWRWAADAEIDDARIYNRALTDEELAQFQNFGLVAHWEFDEGSGTTIADSSGNGNAVSFAAGTPTWTTGIRDGALEFDGSADVDTDANFSPPATGTIALWWYANATPTSTERVLGSGDSWELRYTSSERLSFDFGSGIVYYGSETYAPGRWYHLVFMYNSDDDTYSLYVNGQLTTSGSRTITAPADGILSFGSRTGYSPSFNGRLDDIRVYNYELSTAEVTELFGLIGHWTFDEGSGTMIADSSLYANDAYFNAGTPTWTTGVMGGALEFDGSSDAVTGTEFDPPEEGCVSFWVRCDAAPASRQRPFGLSNTFETFQDADGLLRFDLNWSGAPDTLHPTEAFQFRSRWRHVLVNFRSSDDAYELYFDGELDISGIYPSNLTKQVANFLSFGTRTGSTQYFTGALDDFRIYNRWLLPGEVADVYGLIARWNFEESSGTLANDSSGKDNHATFVSAPTLAANGAYSPNTGFGVELDGTSEYVDAGASLMNNLESFTIMGWIHPDSTTPDKSFFGQNDLVEVGIDYSANQIDFWTANGGSISGTVPLSVGKWNHVTAVGDGTGLKLYLNGNEVATGGSATANYGSNSYDFRIGEGVLDPTGDYFDGSFDDVRIYGRAATADEIFNLYRGGRPAGVRIIRWVETR